MKKNGFIATSLIYSFFLVFIAILAALLNNYIADKTITERYNDEIRDALNNKRYSVKIYSTNANVQEGFTLSNLISDGNFKSIDNYWVKVGNATYNKSTNHPESGMSLEKESLYSEGRSYLYQTINVDPPLTIDGESYKNQYYFSISHYQHFTSPVLQTYIDTPSSEFISTNTLDTCNTTTNPCTYDGSWIKTSKIYEVETEDNVHEDNVHFVVGDNFSHNYSGKSYFTDATVINLTAAFGAGNEPSAAWVDENIEYFTGTLNYLKLDNIKSGDEVKIKFSPYNGYENKDKLSVTCKSSVSGADVSYTMEVKENKDDNRQYGTLTLNSITDDVTCDVVWRK